MEVIFDFHYNFINKKEFPGTKATLCLTDTDSLLYNLQVDDLYARMANHRDRFNYPTNHPLYRLVNKGTPGKFKDELGSQYGLEFIGLRAKAYSLLTANNYNKKTLKGISKSVVSRKINHEMYKKCLFEESLAHQTNMSIRSYNQQYYTVSLSKTSLNSFDDKRWIQPDHLTLAHGHTKIPPTPMLVDDDESEDSQDTAL